MRLFQMQGDLRQRDVRRLLYQSQDLIGMGFDAVRPKIAALRSRMDRTRLPPLGDPVDRRRRRNPKPFRRRATRYPAFHRGNQPFS
jgi:hypothetical protein